MFLPASRLVIYGLLVFAQGLLIGRYLVPKLEDEQVVVWVETKETLDAAGNLVRATSTAHITRQPEPPQRTFERTCFQPQGCQWDDNNRLTHDPGPSATVCEGDPTKCVMSDEPKKNLFVAPKGWNDCADINHPCETIPLNRLHGPINFGPTYSVGVTILFDAAPKVEPEFNYPPNSLIRVDDKGSLHSLAQPPVDFAVNVLGCKRFDGWALCQGFDVAPNGDVERWEFDDGGWQLLGDAVTSPYAQTGPAGPASGNRHPPQGGLECPLPKPDGSLGACWWSDHPGISIDQPLGSDRNPGESIIAYLKRHMPKLPPGPALVDENGNVHTMDGLMLAGETQSGHATAIKTDEDGYVICSPVQR